MLGLRLQELAQEPFFVHYSLTPREDALRWSPAGFKLRNLVTLQLTLTADRVTRVALVLERSLIDHPDLGWLAVEMAQAFLGNKVPGSLALDLKDPRPGEKMLGRTRLVREEARVSLVSPGQV